MFFRFLSLFLLSFFFLPFAQAAVPSELYSNPVISVRYDHDNPYKHLWHSTGVFVNAEGYVLAGEEVLENDGTLIGCAASENGEDASDNCVYTFRLIERDKLNGILLLKVNKVLVDEKWYSDTEYRKKFSDFPSLSFAECESFLKNAEATVHLYDWEYTAHDDDSCYKNGSIEGCYHMDFVEEDASFLNKYTKTGKNGVDKFTKQYFSFEVGEPRYTLGALVTDAEKNIVGFHEEKTLSAGAGFSTTENILAFLQKKNIDYETASTDICEEQNTYEFPRDVTDGEMKNKLTKSILHIESRYQETNKVYAFGSGFFIGDDYHIISNHHVVDLAQEEDDIDLRGCIQNETNTQLECPFVLKVVDVDTENDLALLTVKEVINGMAFRRWTLAKYLGRNPDRIAPLSLENIRTAKKGETITTYGFPSIDDGHWEKNKLPLQLTTGEITNMWIQNFKAGARVVGGISGGPTFGEDGNLVGVVYAFPGNDPEKSLHIHTQKLIKLLKKNNISQKEEEETPAQEEKKSPIKHTEEIHVLKKSFKKVIVEGVVSCNKQHDTKPLRKQCIKENIVDFIQEKNSEKRRLMKECRAENAQDVPACVQEKIEEL